MTPEAGKPAGKSINMMAQGKMKLRQQPESKMRYVHKCYKQQRSVVSFPGGVWIHTQDGGVVMVGCLYILVCVCVVFVCLVWCVCI